MSGSLTRVGEILRKGDATFVMVCCVVLVNNVGLLGGGKMLEVEVEEGQKGRLNLARKINKSYSRNSYNSFGPLHVLRAYIL